LSIEKTQDSYYNFLDRLRYFLKEKRYILRAANTAFTFGAYNLSCNSYILSPTEKRIQQLINESSIELFPKQIADALHVKQGTIRPHLRRMLLKGIIVQPYKGAYCDKSTYDVRFVRLLVHNLRLHFCVVGDVEHWEHEEVVGGVKVFVCFGSERRLVSGRISYDVGMDRAACLLAVNRWIDICEKRLGHEIGDLVLSVFELNKDYAGLKLEGGIHCVTKRVLLDTIERVYQKEDAVRHEYRINKKMTLTQFDQVFNSDSASMLGVQSNLDNQRQLNELKEAQKFMNLRLLEIQKMQEALVKAITSLAGSPESTDTRSKSLGPDYSR